MTCWSARACSGSISSGSCAPASHWAWIPASVTVASAAAWPALRSRHHSASPATAGPRPSA
ncbi:MAG TPA: hypothetical protein VGJ19_03340 [Streptosporangiaceae bacterium]